MTVGNVLVILGSASSDVGLTVANTEVWQEFDPTE